MFDKLWEKLSEGLTDRGLFNTYGPAVVFVAGGLLAYKRHYGLEGVLKKWNVQSVVAQVALVAVAVFLIGFAANLVEDIEGWGIRICEGYFPRYLDWLRLFMSWTWKLRIDRKQNLLQKVSSKSSPWSKIRKRRLDAEVARLPVDSGDAMPTLLGNLLFAAEDYSRVRYGLSCVVCWPRLYPLLSHTLRQSIDMSRNKLDESARLLLWSLLFLIWTTWEPWSLISLIVAFIAYRGMISAAGLYGDLIRSAFDLNRFDLYKKLAWPLPDKPEGEELLGQALDIYLFRGIAPANATFERTNCAAEPDGPA